MKRIAHLWAWVADNPEGMGSDEGLVSSLRVIDELRVYSMLVTENESNLPVIRALAQQSANETGQTLRLIRADVTTVCDTVAPQPKEP